MFNILKHIWDTILKPKWLMLIGAFIIIIVGVSLYGRGNKGSATSPGSGPEGTVVTVSYPKLKSVPNGAALKFYDAGQHGFMAVNNGAAAYVTYDQATGLSYTAPTSADTADSSHSKFSAAVPGGICGLIIQSAQDKKQPDKVLQVSLVDGSGKQIPGTPVSHFNLICDRYKLNIKMDVSKDPVLPDGADQSTVTATLSVTGPAQFVNGARVNPSAPKIMLTSPLGFTMVNFSTSLGVLAPSPSNVKTGANGSASVTISSADAGIAKVTAVAMGIGDASINVHFPPKITAVQQDFVEPVSPTNYMMTTIPKNSKDLTFDWAFLPAPGQACGHLTDPASGLAENKNGFFHGPAEYFPEGCPEAYEFASQIKVMVTDKDNQTDSKTFSARAFEGKGPTPLP